MRTVNLARYMACYNGKGILLHVNPPIAAIKQTPQISIYITRRQ